MRCPGCNFTLPSPRPAICPECNESTIVSVDEDTLDQMIQDASTPSLVTLFRRAKDAGVIGSFTNYPATG